MRYLILIVIGFILIANAEAEHVQMYLPPGEYAHRLTIGSLEDPLGARPSRHLLIGRVVVAIFSSPTWSRGGKQKRWAKTLANDPATRLPHWVSLFLIEDMSQAGWFKGMAERRMKRDFTPGSRPILLLDRTGIAFREAGVKRDSTEILIYDKNGKLRDEETQLDHVSQTLERAENITRRLED